MTRAAVAFPGRGSYGPTSLGSLPAGHAWVRRADELRASAGRPPLSELDSATAFDPVYTVGQQIIETIRRHEAISHAAAAARAQELFERVQIPSPQRRLAAYPHELSGGMR